MRYLLKQDGTAPSMVMSFNLIYVCSFVLKETTIAEKGDFFHRR